MKTLVASTIAVIVSKAKEHRFIRLVSDSTTLTRIALKKSDLEMASLGFGFTAYDDIVVSLDAGQDIFAVSTGTPNISYAVVRPETVRNAIRIG